MLDKPCRIIFLDIDGVLVTERSLREGGKSGTQAAMDQSCVAELNRLVEQTGAKVVVSGTWRFGGLEFVLERLESNGVKADVIGITPKLQRQIGNVWLSATRGSEIGKWLSVHPDVKQFVILDDDDSMGSLRNWHVCTSMATGLTPALAEESKKVLERATRDLW